MDCPPILANTGAAPALLIGIGVCLMLSGALFLIATRRRLPAGAAALALVALVVGAISVSTPSAEAGADCHPGPVVTAPATASASASPSTPSTPPSTTVPATTAPTTTATTTAPATAAISGTFVSHGWKQSQCLEDWATSAPSAMPPSVLAVAGATVNLRDASTAIVATTVTTATGAYEFSGIAPGDYTVEIVQPPPASEYVAYILVTGGENDPGSLACEMSDWAAAAPQAVTAVVGPAATADFYTGMTACFGQHGLTGNSVFQGGNTIRYPDDGGPQPEICSGTIIFPEG